MPSRDLSQAVWRRPVALAAALLFVLSWAFPIGAGLAKDTSSFPKWWGIVDVTLAFVIAVSAFVIQAMVGKNVDKQAEETAYRCQLNRSTQHFLEVYSQEFEILKFFLDADLTGVPLCPDPTGYSRTGLFSSGSIVVIAHLCFRSSRAAKGFADHRNRLSHPWPL